MDDGCRFSDTPVFAGRMSLLAAVELLAAVALLATTGCHFAAARRVEPLEARLREREQTIDELERRLADTRESLTRSREELRQASFERTPGDSEGSAPRLLEVVAGTREQIEIGSLLSGGLDRDGKPGDELLSVLVSPLNGSRPRRIPDATLLLEVFDFGQPAESQRIGQWSFDAGETASFWHDGVIGTGYRVVIPWQSTPKSRQLTAHARITLSNGSELDATRELKITPPAP